MQIFSFKAKDETGTVVEDTIQAADKDAAVTAIRGKGLEVLTVKRPEGMGRGMFSKKISVSEKAALCRFLSTMLRSGMSLPEAVEIIKEEATNKRLKKILSDVSFQTQKGKSLSYVLSQYDKDFDVIFLTMVRVGEESGTLEKSFDYLAVQLTASHELTQKVIGSMMYPVVIVAAMVAEGLMMMLFVLPRISKVFLRLELPLPIYTKLLLTVGEFFGEHVVLVIAATILMGVVLVFLVMIQSTRAVMIRFIIRLPVVKKVVKYIDVARFSRTLSTLLKSGVPIIDALDVSAQTLSQKRFRSEAEAFGESIAEGKSLSGIMTRNRKLFPSTMIQTIKAGEQSGSLEKVLEELADFYEREVDYSLKRLTALLEPVLMLLIGLVVGVMVIMMIAPIYSIIGGLQATID